MGTFSYTTDKKLSMGNRIGYKYTLTDVQTTGSTIHTPFKKIIGELYETISPATTTIVTASKTVANGVGTTAKLNLKAGATDADGSVIVVGLL